MNKVCRILTKTEAKTLLNRGDSLLLRLVRQGLITKVNIPGTRKNAPGFLESEIKKLITSGIGGRKYMPCAVCGKEFEIPPSIRNQKTCSHNCSREFKRRAWTNYRDAANARRRAKYNKDSAYRARFLARLRARRESNRSQLGGMCVVCGDEISNALRNFRRRKTCSTGCAQSNKNQWQNRVRSAQKYSKTKVCVICNKKIPRGLIRSGAQKTCPGECAKLLFISRRASGGRKWRNDNRGRLAEYKKRYYAENRKRFIEYSRLRRLNPTPAQLDGARKSNRKYKQTRRQTRNFFQMLALRHALNKYAESQQQQTPTETTQTNTNERQQQVG